MTDRIGDSGETPSILPRQQRKMYEAEYKHAADLFQRTLNEYSKSDNKYQKEEFKKVMGEALHILKETASELRRNDLLGHNSEIERDYNTFQTDETQSSKLKTDLDRAKHSI